MRISLTDLASAFGISALTVITIVLVIVKACEGTL
jgi:hypothetical protein